MLIDINLLGAQRPVKAGARVRRRLPLPGRKPLLYALFLLAVAYAAYDRLPGLLSRGTVPDDLSTVLDEFAAPGPVPPPVAPEPTPPPAPVDTPAVVSAPAPVVEPTPASPSEPVIPPPPPPLVVSGTFDLPAAIAATRRSIVTYLAVHRAIVPMAEFELIAVGEGGFVSEVTTDAPAVVGQVAAALQRRVHPDVQYRTASASTEDAFPTAHLWGSGVRPQAGTVGLPTEFPDREATVARVRALARRRGFQLREQQARPEVLRAGVRLVPLVLRFQGNDRQSEAFLEDLLKANLNLVIHKINTIPVVSGRIGAATVIRMVLLMDVILSGAG